MIKRDWTGQKDRKGKNIYVGDWVIADVGGIGSHFHLLVAEREDHELVLLGSVSEYPFWKARDIEVFGNIEKSPTLPEALNNYKKG